MKVTPPLAVALLAHGEGWDAGKEFCGYESLAMSRAWLLTKAGEQGLSYAHLLDSCLQILRRLQFESGTLRGPLVSDASQLLPLVWHYAYRRPKPYRFWQLLLVYQHNPS